MEPMIWCTQILCIPFYPLTMTANLMTMCGDFMTSCRDFWLFPATVCTAGIPIIQGLTAMVGLLPNILSSVASSFEAVERITNVAPQACLDLLIAIEKLFSEIVYWIK